MTVYVSLLVLEDSTAMKGSRFKEKEREDDTLIWKVPGHSVVVSVELDVMAEARAAFLLSEGTVDEVSGEMAFVVVSPRRGSFAGMRWGRRRNVFELDMLL